MIGKFITELTHRDGEGRRQRAMAGGDEGGGSKSRVTLAFNSLGKSGSLRESPQKFSFDGNVYHPSTGG
jgi:hypothetical protein